MPTLGVVKEALSLSIGMSHRKGVPQREALSVFACLPPYWIVRTPPMDRGRTEPRENAASLRATYCVALGHASAARMEDHVASLAATVDRMGTPAATPLSAGKCIPHEYGFAHPHTPPSARTRLANACECDAPRDRPTLPGTLPRVSGQRPRTVGAGKSVPLADSLPIGQTPMR